MITMEIRQSYIQRTTFLKEVLELAINKKLSIQWVSQFVELQQGSQLKLLSELLYALNEDWKESSKRSWDSNIVNAVEGLLSAPSQIPQRDMCNYVTDKHPQDQLT